MIPHVFLIRKKVCMCMCMKYVYVIKSKNIPDYIQINLVSFNLIRDDLNC